MTQETEDKLATMLDNGWIVAGYTVAMMAAGAMVYSILLQKDVQLTTINIVKNAGKELGRAEEVFSPMPTAAPKKGWF